MVRVYILTWINRSVNLTSYNHVCYVRRHDSHCFHLCVHSTFRFCFITWILVYRLRRKNKARNFTRQKEKGKKWKPHRMCRAVTVTRVCPSILEQDAEALTAWHLPWQHQASVREWENVWHTFCSTLSGQ